MAANAATAVRVDLAARQLLEGHSASAVVAHLAESQGISRRSAQRYVAQAYRLIESDLAASGISRPQLVAQLVHTLQEAMAQALASGHASAVVGASRELRELLGLAGDQR